MVFTSFARKSCYILTVFTKCALLLLFGYHISFCQILIMETVQSKRGKDKFLHEGYLYVFDRFSAERSKKFWRGEQKDECKARLHTILDNEQVLVQKTHESDAAELQTTTINFLNEAEGNRDKGKPVLGYRSSENAKER